ncbi:hypothetical protein D3C80_1452130 [compost metagenome]
MGRAMVLIKSRPTKIDMTMPGTFKSPSPKVTRPITKAAITTPPMVPEPPRMETPPSTTIVTTSSSQPCAIEGRVEPRRDVRHTAAIPLINPVSRNRMNLTRSTGIPEKRAAKGLVPMTNTWRPKFVACRRMAKMTAIMINSTNSKDITQNT